MSRLFTCLLLIAANWAPITVCTQTVSQEIFQQYRDSVDQELKQLRDSLDRQQRVMEMAELYYERAGDYVSLREEINAGYIALFTAIATFVVFVFGALGVSLYNARKRIDEYRKDTQEELYRRLSSWIGDKEETVKFLVEQQRRRNQLKDAIRILIISHLGDKEQRPYTDLLERGFSKLTEPLRLDEQFSVPSVDTLSAFDVVILDNQHRLEPGNWNFSNPQLAGKLEQLIRTTNKADAHFVYYGENNKEWDGGIMRLPPWKDGKEKATANSITTLRQRLIELIDPAI